MSPEEMSADKAHADEGACPSDDGTHCECWWEGLAPCCRCNHGADEPERQMMGGIYSNPPADGLGCFWLAVMFAIAFAFYLARR